VRGVSESVAAVAVAAVCASGCGDRDPTPATIPPAPREWQEIMDTLPPVADLESPNVCGRGDGRCITKVVGEMKRRLRVLAAACDHNAAFALLYLRVTEDVSGTRFRSRAFLNHLDAVFAKFYFRSFERYYGGRRSEVPEVWRIAFEAADERKTTGLGDMLLGMNAHISRDLAYSLVRTGLKAPDGRSAEPDFNKVNRLLVSLAVNILRDVSRRFDPTVGRDALPLTRSGLLNFGEIFAQWRAEAWKNAERILNARGPARRRLERASETCCCGRSTSRPPVGPG
jgi:Family of unknown function (DUF5995)